MGYDLSSTSLSELPTGVTGPTTSRVSPNKCVNHRWLIVKLTRRIYNENPPQTTTLEIFYNTAPEMSTENYTITNSKICHAPEDRPGISNGLWPEDQEKKGSLFIRMVVIPASAISQDPELALDGK